MSNGTNGNGQTLKRLLFWIAAVATGFVAFLGKEVYELRQEISYDQGRNDTERRSTSHDKDSGP